MTCWLSLDRPTTQLVENPEPDAVFQGMPLGIRQSVICMPVSAKGGILSYSCSVIEGQLLHEQEGVHRSARACTEGYVTEQWCFGHCLASQKLQVMAMLVLWTLPIRRFRSSWPELATHSLVQSVECMSFITKVWPFLCLVEVVACMFFGPSG